METAMFSGLFSNPTSITNLVQTLGGMLFAGLITKGYLNSDQTSAIIAGLCAIVVLIFNVVNHSNALAATPPKTAG
jgi:sterol desaturase/sphingolipid hydroxylase (fatty acid hydroxylase superfamily)